MNSLIALFGIEAWKPVLTALVLPPVPLLLLTLIGARLMLARRGWGWLLIITSVVLIWLSGCIGTADALTRFVLRPPAALDADHIQALKAQNKQPIAILVLGGGVEPLAPEYGAGNLMYRSLERLRYGVWLGRQTGLPVGFSGGVGWGQADATPEARVAAQIAATEFGRPLKWVEENSHDTRENAALSVTMLRRAGINHIVLVTNGWHMPRALALFEAAAGGSIQVEPAPMGMARQVAQPPLDWLPSGDGMNNVRAVLREILGRAVGA